MINHTERCLVWLTLLSNSLTYTFSSPPPDDSFIVRPKTWSSKHACVTTQKNVMCKSIITCVSRDKLSSSGLFLPLLPKHTYPPPICPCLLRCTCMFVFGWGISRPSSPSDCTDRLLEAEPQWEGGKSSVPRRCCDLNDLRRDVGAEGWRGAPHVHLLTCSICLFFLPEWVSGASSQQFLTVINRDSPHPPAQFSEGQLTMKEKRNGNICCGTSCRPPLSERIQLTINGTDLGYRVQFFSWGGGAAERLVSL